MVRYCWGKGVITRRAEPFDAGEFGETARGAAPVKHRDEVDGFGDQGARDGDDGFLDELLKPPQRTDSAASMDGANAARMAGAPGFDKIERLSAAHLANGDAIRTKAQ